MRQPTSLATSDDSFGLDGDEGGFDVFQAVALGAGAHRLAHAGERGFDERRQGSLQRLRHIGRRWRHGVFDQRSRATLARTDPHRRAAVELASSMVRSKMCSASPEPRMVSRYTTCGRPMRACTPYSRSSTSRLISK